MLENKGNDISKVVFVLLVPVLINFNVALGQQDVSSKDGFIWSYLEKTNVYQLEDIVRQNIDDICLLPIEVFFLEQIKIKGEFCLKDSVNVEIQLNKWGEEMYLGVEFTNAKELINNYFTLIDIIHDRLVGYEESERIIKDANNIGVAKGFLWSKFDEKHEITNHIYVYIYITILPKDIDINSNVVDFKPKLILRTFNT